MSFVGSMFQDSKGAGFKAGNIELDHPVSEDNARDAYKASLGVQDQQQAFLNALQAQNGIGNQMSVYNQLQGVANGTGPNPAMAALHQQTGNNIAAQNALMAGQRGANTNVGLMARQAAMQGGNLQQQSIGQAANLQANQSLSAMNQLGSMAGQQVSQQANAMSGLSASQQAQQQMLLNAIAQYNNSRVGMQSNINNANATIANTNAQGQQQMFGGLMNGMLGGSSGGGGGGGGGGMMSMMGGMSEGGMVTHGAPVRYAEGGPVLNDPMQPEQVVPMQAAPQPQMPAPAAPIAPQNTDLPPLRSLQELPNSPIAMSLVPPPNLNEHNDKPQSFVAQTLQEPQLQQQQPVQVAENKEGKEAMYKAGGAIPNAIKKIFTMGMSQGGPVDGESLANEGLKVPGQASVPGNSPQNDKVPAVLSPGEIVIPRDIAQHANAPELAAEFVRKVLANGQKKSGGFADGGEQEEADAEQEAQAMSDKTVPAAVVETGAPPLQAPSAVAAPTSMAPDYVERLDKDMFQQRADTANYYRAMQGANGAQVKALDQAGQDLKSVNEKFDAQNAKYDTERQALIKDYANQKIDPTRYVGSMSTGSKIMTTIGLMLGGMGSGLAHQQNNALAYLNSQIDRDIDAQKAELGKRQTLLSANMQQFGQMHEAQAMTKANMLDMAKLQLQKAVAQSNNVGMKQRGQLAIDQLQLMSDQTIGPLKQRNDMIKAAMGQGAMEADPASLVQHVVPTAQQSSVTSAIGKAKHITQNVGTMMDNFDKASKDVRFLSGGKPLYSTVVTPPSLKSLDALEDPLIHDEIGRISPIAKESIMKLHPNAWDSDETIAAKRKGYKEFVLGKMNEAQNTAKAFNINLDGFAATNPVLMALKKAGPNGPAMLKWAKENPQNPKAQMFFKKIGLTE